MKLTSALRIIGSAVLLLVPAIALAGGGSGKADKVDVCHVNGTGAYVLINISRSALPAHLAHGDAVPGSLVGDKYVGDTCSVQDTTRAASPVLSFSPLGWGGWSCPAGTVVIGGGYEPADATVLVSEAAKPDSASGLYPKYPHYTFAEGETGWVVQNGNTPQSLTIYAICIPSPQAAPQQ